jgi:hypothetical protein
MKKFGWTIRSKSASAAKLLQLHRMLHPKIDIAGVEKPGMKGVPRPH